MCMWGNYEAKEKKNLGVAKYCRIWTTTPCYNCSTSPHCQFIVTIYLKLTTMYNTVSGYSYYPSGILILCKINLLTTVVVQLTLSLLDPICTYQLHDCITPLSLM